MHYDYTEAYHMTEKELKAVLEEDLRKADKLGVLDVFMKKLVGLSESAPLLSSILCEAASGHPYEKPPVPAKDEPIPSDHATVDPREGVVDKDGNVSDYNFDEKEDKDDIRKPSHKTNESITSSGLPLSETTVENRGTPQQTIGHATEKTFRTFADMRKTIPFHKGSFISSGKAYRKFKDVQKGIAAGREAKANTVAERHSSDPQYIANDMTSEYDRQHPSTAAGYHYVRQPYDDIPAHHEGEYIAHHMLYHSVPASYAVTKKADFNADEREANNHSWFHDLDRLTMGSDDSTLVSHKDAAERIAAMSGRKEPPHLLNAAALEKAKTITAKKINGENEYFGTKPNVGIVDKEKPHVSALDNQLTDVKPVKPEPNITLTPDQLERKNRTAQDVQHSKIIGRNFRSDDPMPTLTYADSNTNSPEKTFDVGKEIHGADYMVPKKAPAKMPLLDVSEPKKNTETTSGPLASMV